MVVSNNNRAYNRKPKRYFTYVIAKAINNQSLIFLIVWSVKIQLIVDAREFHP